MAYDPADLRLPPWLIHMLDTLVAVSIPVGRQWRIGLTRPGAMLLFSILGVWAAALYSANNLLYLCGAMLLLIALGAIVQGVAMLRHIPELSSYIPTHIEVDSAWVVHEETACGTGQIGLIDVTLDERLALQWWCNGSQAWLRGRIHGKQRGVIGIETFNCCSSAPIGLWNISIDQRTPWHIAVLPTPAPWPEASGAKIEHADDAQIREGDDFHDLRAYVAGDSPSRIHWRKAGSNTQDWRVKRFIQHDAPSQTPILVVDLRLPAHADATAFENLLGMAWGWFKHHLDNRLPIERMVIGQQYYLCQTTAEQQACRMALAMAQPESTAPQQQEGLYLSLCTTPS